MEKLLALPHYIPARLSLTYTDHVSLVALTWRRLLPANLGLLMRHFGIISQPLNANDDGMRDTLHISTPPNELHMGHEQIIRFKCVAHNM